MSSEGIVRILFVGDLHIVDRQDMFNWIDMFEELHDRTKFDFMVLLGDMEFPEVPSFSFPWGYIYGNHDNLDILYSSNGIDLHRNIYEVDGVKIAGLGGNFQMKAWNEINNIEEWIKKYGGTGRREHALFRDDVEFLLCFGYDILVSHDAPSNFLNYENQNPAMDRLLKENSPKLFAVHGHFHIPFYYQKFGVDIYSVGIRQYFIKEV